MINHTIHPMDLKSWVILLNIVLWGGCKTSLDDDENACDGLVAIVQESNFKYQQEHRVFPVPQYMRQQVISFIPKLAIHSKDSRPIDFDQYLNKARLYDGNDNLILDKGASFGSIAKLPKALQCQSYFKGPEIKPTSTPPIYIQVYKDHSPVSQKPWTYFKYNIAFDWSGLAKERSFLASIGVFLTGGNSERWHRFDVHTSIVIGIDENQIAQTYTVMQHNYQTTYLRGRDFKGEPLFATATSSNEIYLDTLKSDVEMYRVVPFLNDWGYLYHQDNEPWLWAVDEVRGRSAGAEDITFEARFISPQHPMATFPGLLAPADRFFGQNVGRDGPPGFDFYALPDWVAMPDLVAMGNWREGQLDQWAKVKPHIRGLLDSSWGDIKEILRSDLAKDMNSH